MPARRRLLLAALLLPALAACAGDGPPGDGFGIGPGRERERVPAHLPNVFISPAGEPFRAAQGAPYPVAAWFQRADANHDGRLTRDELRADALSFFDRLDANHDGVIDGLELQDYEQEVAPEILPRIADLHAYEGMDMSLSFDDPNNTESRSNHKDRGRNGSGGGRPPTARGVGVQGAAVFSMINMPEPVAAADTHFDGRITRSEFADAADHRFDLLDKVGRGYLSLDALPKTPIQTALLQRAKDDATRRRRRGEDRPPPTDQTPPP